MTVHKLLWVVVTLGTYLDIEGKVNNESDLIRRYREIMHPECDMAIEDIINES